MRTHSLFQSFVSNLGWMAISVLLALMIWVAANMANNPVEQNEVQAVPVRIELPEGFVLSRSPDITAVTAVVRAERNQWDLITPGDILVTADLRNLKEPGEYRIELEAEVASPLHGRVVALRPSTLTLKIDYEVEKRVAIRVVVTRDPPLGYTYPSDLACSSTEALVRGSAERVAEVAYVEARLDLADELNPVTKVVSLIPVQNSGLRVRDVELDPASVSCDVPIQPREDVFQMPVQPKITGNPPPGYNVVRYAEIVPDTVALTGDLAAIRSLPGLVRTAPIDLTNRTETFTTEVPVDLPPGVRHRARKSDHQGHHCHRTADQHAAVRRRAGRSHRSRSHAVSRDGPGRYCHCLRQRAAQPPAQPRESARGGQPERPAGGQSSGDAPGHADGVAGHQRAECDGQPGRAERDHRSAESHPDAQPGAHVDSWQPVAGYVLAASNLETT